jgi:hypothetical protein
MSEKVEHKIDKRWKREKKNVFSKEAAFPSHKSQMKKCDKTPQKKSFFEKKKKSIKATPHSISI